MNIINKFGENEKYFVCSSIVNKDCFLSSYGFNCGYIERRENDFLSLVMHKENNTYIIELFIRPLNPYEQGKREIKGFYKINEAKKYFFELCDKYNMIKIKNRIQ